MRRFQENLPAWPRYEQYGRSFERLQVFTILAVFYFVVVFRFLRSVPILGNFWFGLSMWIFLGNARALWTWIHNVRERRRWRRDVGTVVKWRQVRELTKAHPADWTLLANPLYRGSLGFSASVEGGWDAVALYNKRTCAMCVVKELSWEITRRNAEAWGIETYVGGEVGGGEVPNLLRGLRDPETRDAAISRLGRVNPRVTTLVPSLVALLEDGDEDVRRAAVSAMAAVGPMAKDVVPKLLKALENAGRRREAIWALGKMGTLARVAIPDLVQVIQGDEASEVRCLAVRALASVVPRHPGAIPGFIEAFRDRGLADVGFCASEALLGMGEVASGAIPELERCANDESGPPLTQEWARRTVRGLRQL